MRGEIKIIYKNVTKINTLGMRIEDLREKVL